MKIWFLSSLHKASFFLLSFNKQRSGRKSSDFTLLTGTHTRAVTTQGWTKYVLAGRYDLNEIHVLCGVKRGGVQEKERRTRNTGKWKYGITMTWVLSEVLVLIEWWEIQTEQVCLLITDALWFLDMSYHSKNTVSLLLVCILCSRVAGSNRKELAVKCKKM